MNRYHRSVNILCMRSSPAVHGHLPIQQQYHECTHGTMVALIQRQLSAPE